MNRSIPFALSPLAPISVAPTTTLLLGPYDVGLLRLQQITPIVINDDLGQDLNAELQVAPLEAGPWKASGSSLGRVGPGASFCEPLDVVGYLWIRVIDLLW